MSLLAYIVDDEPLAIERLRRLLQETGRVAIAGSTTKPREALRFLQANRVDVVFLDIAMPRMNGFDLISKISPMPNVVFTTAYDQYALKAFEVSSVDYLLKPVEPSHLERALNKVERLSNAVSPGSTDLRKLIDELAAAMRQAPRGFPARIATRLAGRVCFIDLARVTHFYAEDKLTYAVAEGNVHCIDHTITDLEQRLDPTRFIRIHRATMINSDWIKEVGTTLGGAMVVRLKDAKRTELIVARNRAAEVKQRLGI